MVNKYMVKVQIWTPKTIGNHSLDEDAILILCFAQDNVVIDESSVGHNSFKTRRP